LPATVKDAMSPSKFLDIPYLWIDRLCIVQDDTENKQHNISWMASIYANSFFAIVAAQGPDAEYGIREIGS
ncbi:heterokaryon incompatibility, partial [Lentithecium fluviatile CBS 122367]